eukprot:TRINITY_DN1837_c0_g1_i1.p1 TRINITY_DN1837_c0_g1~~TRINITY_DN1837_c0_g1_i1.p1  ORF type:complete len:118 (-),score=46.27 TRINITY_DN1837_c0_g1_i1:417-770(-)
MLRSLVGSEMCIRDRTEQGVAAREALAYLESFGSDGWKFRKVRQTWLLQNLYDDNLVPEDHFPQLLKYMAGLKGVSRDKTLQQAQEMVKGFEEADEAVEVDAIKQSRAVQIVGALIE